MATKVRLANVLQVDRQLLQRLSSQLRPHRGQGLSTLLHALSVFGADVELSGEQRPVRVLKLILDADYGAKYFGGAGALVETRYGASFPLVERSATSTNQSGAQAHYGQALATLAASGIPLTSEIKLPGGRLGTLRMVLDDLCANFVLDGEIYWDAIAIALYLPPVQDWRNKFGDVFTFDQLALELCRRSPSDSSCFGTHRLISLAILLDTDRSVHLLSPRARQGVREQLLRAVDCVTATQADDGAWCADWSGVTPVVHSIPRPAPSYNERIQVTSHHLEWLITAAQDGISAPPPVIRRAAEWLRDALVAVSEHDERWLKQNYCPASHAMRTLIALSSSEAGEDAARLGHQETERMTVMASGTAQRPY